MPNQKQDIDAGIEQKSPAPREPHRARDTQDRGGRYVREQHEEAVQPRRYQRGRVERDLPPPSDPDDPAAA